MDFAARLAAIMSERGLGVRALARRVFCDPALISRLRSGQQQPSPKIARLLDDALQADGDLAALASGISHTPEFDGTFTPDDAERLSLAAKRPSRLDARAIDALAAVLAAQRDLEDRVGSAPMLAPAATQATTAERLVRDAPASLRTRLVDVTAQYGYFHAWLHENTGRLERATALYDRALGQATEAGDVNLVSELISMKGHVAWARGDVAEVVRLSQSAQRDPTAFAGQHAVSAMQEARALAIMGDAQAVSRKLTGADTALTRAAERGDDRPPWLYYHSTAFFEIQRGQAWLHLGAHDGRYTGKAVTALAAGVAELDETARGSEWGASYLLHLAGAHIQAGAVDEACDVAMEVARIARRLASDTLTANLRRLHSRMLARWGSTPCVAELAEALRPQQR